MCAMFWWRTSRQSNQGKDVDKKMTRKIYLASSWRNKYQPDYVRYLRDLGHEVYDFRNPDGSTGFAWDQLDSDWSKWSTKTYLKHLNDRLAVIGFTSDMEAMKWSDTVVLLNPCGTSAHLELGWGVGAGKRTAIMYPEATTNPELMVKMCDELFTHPHDLENWLNRA